MAIGYKEENAVWLEQKKQELEQLLNEIKVTPDQKSKVWSAVLDTQSQISPSIESLFNLARELIKYVATPGATEREAIHRAKAMEALREEMIPIRIQLLFKIKQILNPQQQEKLSQHIQNKINELEDKLSALMHLTP